MMLAIRRAGRSPEYDSSKTKHWGRRKLKQDAIRDLNPYADTTSTMCVTYGGTAEIVEPFPNINRDDPANHS